MFWECKHVLGMGRIVVEEGVILSGDGGSYERVFLK
jgi:hypothetical protein